MPQVPFPRQYPPELIPLKVQSSSLLLSFLILPPPSRLYTVDSHNDSVHLKHNIDVQEWLSVLRGISASARGARINSDRRIVVVTTSQSSDTAVLSLPSPNHKHGNSVSELGNLVGRRPTWEPLPRRHPGTRAKTACCFGKWEGVRNPDSTSVPLRPERCASRPPLNHRSSS